MNTTDPVDENEEITRFIFSKNDYRKDMTIREYAFLPTKNNKTSISRIDDLAEPQICEIGKSIATISKRRLKGRTDFKASMVYNAHNNTEFSALNFEPDNIPLHHANIIGWPDPYNKDKSKVLAQEIAAAVNEYVKENDRLAFIVFNQTSN